MSVRGYSRKETEEYAEAVKQNNIARRSVRYSKPVLKNLLTMYEFKTSQTEDKIIDEVIDRAFWYYFVANSTAYAMQYQQNVDYFNQESIEPVKVRINDKNKFNSELSLLRYNLATNDGNVFLSDVWTDILDRIIEALRASIISGTNY